MKSKFIAYSRSADFLKKISQLTDKYLKECSNLEIIFFYLLKKRPVLLRVGGAYLHQNYDAELAITLVLSLPESIFRS